MVLLLTLLVVSLYKPEFPKKELSFWNGFPVGIGPVKLFSDNRLICTGISPSKPLSLKSNKVSLVRLPMAVGMSPESLQLLRLKTVMSRNGVKLKLSNFPLSSKLERSICETSSLETSQTTLVQLQRLMMLLLDHESREDGSNTKVFFHVMRASACVVGEEGRGWGRGRGWVRVRGRPGVQLWNRGQSRSRRSGSKAEADVRVGVRSEFETEVQGRASGPGLGSRSRSGLRSRIKVSSGIRVWVWVSHPRSGLEVGANVWGLGWGPVWGLGRHCYLSLISDMKG
ncbi:hypothetical protein G4B88_024651 [Cannabis sativa]|uniref:Uncharacterized protein n=1 Tax=Cannabis sativa TaxID=3483 RepID=A0A7J6GY87_CANSA|nr:hypothetical protein G4B88_024651 [Cannabis sativa]